MEQDTEYIKLPLEERCVHKVICVLIQLLTFTLVVIVFLTTFNK